MVNDLQNPTAANREYLPSRFHCSDNTMKIPKINAPIMLTIKTLSGRVLKSNGDSVILYLRKAPKTDPIAKTQTQNPSFSSLDYVLF